MIAWVTRRLFAAVAVVLCVISLTFFLIRATPGGPFDRERKLPAHIEAKLLEKYRLDGPLHRQYVEYLLDVMRGDLRLSTKYRNRSVNEILAQSLPVSAALGALAFALSVSAGLTLGALAAMRHGGWADAGLMFLALLAISIPTFVSAPLLLLIFALGLGWLPVGGWGGWAHLVLPSICLAAPYAAYIARLTRASLLETLGEDFIRTARAKGLPEWRVVAKHAAKVALLPVVTFLGPLAAHLLTGSIVVETIFNIPGAGRFFVQSVLNRDGFLLGGVVIVYCVLLVGMNLLVDLAYGWLDRRISLDGRH